MADFQFVVKLDEEEKLRLVKASSVKTFTDAAKAHEKSLKETPLLLAKITKSISSSDDISEGLESIQTERTRLDPLVDSDEKSEALEALDEAEEVLTEIVRQSKTHQS